MMKKIHLLLVACWLMMFAQVSATPFNHDGHPKPNKKKIVLIPGNDSHGPGDSRRTRGCSDCLGRGGLHGNR